MWVTRDQFGYLVLFSFSKPVRNYELGIWTATDNKCCEIPVENFPELKWEDEPKEVTLTEVIKATINPKKENYNNYTYDDTYWGQRGGYPKEYMRDSWYGD